MGVMGIQLKWTVLKGFTKSDLVRFEFDLNIVRWAI
jgi:hypothetical protein